jgi:hypothetical protein
MKKSLDRDALKTTCFEAARTTMWEHRPVDVASIDAVAAQLFSIALDHEEFVRGQDRDPDQVTNEWACHGH